MPLGSGIATEWSERRGVFTGVHAPGALPPAKGGMPMSAADSPHGNGAQPCSTCESWKLAETDANGRRDYSKATDCRVLLKRHQESAECVAGGQG